MFDVKKHLIKVQGGRQYLPVAARLVWFRQEHPDWGIETKPITIDTENQFAVFEARVYNAEGKLMATGTKMENIRGFGDWIEKAETGAIGRALAVCGYGTQFAPDLDETTNGRIVDSPQPMGGSQSRPPQARYGGSQFHGNGGGYSDRNRYGSGINGESRSMGANETALHHADADDKDPFSDTDELFEANSTSASHEAAGDSNACSACGKALNSAQQTLSVRKYGVALCPTCQKERRAVEA